MDVTLYKGSVSLPIFLPLISRTIALVVICLAAWGSSKPSEAADFDCGKARSDTEILICGDKELSAADSDFGIAFKKALSAADDKDRDRMIDGQVAWLHYRDLSCGGKKNLDVGNSKARETAVACLKSIYKQRQEFIKPLTGPPPALVPLPVLPPSDWWGIDISSVLGAKAISGPGWFVAVGPNQSIIVQVLARGLPAANQPFLDRDVALLDILTGHVIGTLQDEPQLASLTNTGAYNRHGMKPVMPPLGSMPLDQRTEVVSTSEKCPEPFRNRFHLRKTGSGNDDAEEKYLIVSLLQKKQKIGYESSQHCENDGAPGWTVDFTTLYVEPLGVFPDGTFLGGVGDRYVIRFRPDLTSDFFYGRRDIMLIADSAVPDLPSDDKTPEEALRDIHETIETAGEKQMSHKAVH